MPFWEDSHGAHPSVGYLAGTPTTDFQKARPTEEDLYQEAYEDDHPGGYITTAAGLQRQTHPTSDVVDLMDSDCASDEEREKSHPFGVNEVVVREGLRRPQASPRYNLLARSFAQNTVPDRINLEQPLSDIEDWNDDEDDDDPTFQPPLKVARRVTEDHSTSIRRLQPPRKASNTGKTSSSAISLTENPGLLPPSIGGSGLVRPWRRDKKPRLRDAVGSNPFNAASVKPRKQASINRRRATNASSAEPIDLSGGETSAPQASTAGKEQQDSGRATIAAASRRFGTTDVQQYRDMFLNQRNDIQGGSGVGMGGFAFMSASGRQPPGHNHEPLNDTVEDFQDNDSFSRVSGGRRTGQSRRVSRSGGTKRSTSGRRGGGKTSRGRGRRRGRAGRGRGRSRGGGTRYNTSNRRGSGDGGVWGAENSGGWQVSEAFTREDAEMDLIGGSEITF